MKKIACFLLLTACFFVEAKVLIFTYSYNRPDFVEIQEKTLKKFFQDEYEFVVFNDARDQSMVSRINETCQQLGLRCIRIPQEIHSRPYLPRLPGENFNHPSVRNCNVVQYSLDVLGFEHDDIVVLLDSDMFLVKTFSVRDFLNKYDIGGVQLGNGYVSYLWHALAFLDMRTMPNRHTLSFNCGRIYEKPIDAGGHSYWYLQQNPTVKARYVSQVNPGTLQCEQCIKKQAFLCTHNARLLKENGFDENQIAFIQLANNVEFFHNNSFLHYRGGTNWDGKNAEYHRMKTKALNAYLEKILES